MIARIKFKYINKAIRSISKLIKSALNKIVKQPLYMKYNTFTYQLLLPILSHYIILLYSYIIWFYTLSIHYVIEFKIDLGFI